MRLHSEALDLLAWWKGKDGVAYYTGQARPEGWVLEKDFALPPCKWKTLCH